MRHEGPESKLAKTCDMDRNYTYIAKTFDAPNLSVAAFIELMREIALPIWRRQYEQGSIASVHVLHKIGDIDLQTAATPVRDWRYFAALELSPDAVESVCEAELRAGLDVPALARRGVQYLSNEIAVRPAGAGTAIPRPSPRCPSRPRNQVAAIEYIYIPDEFWDEYRMFMRDVMGPVGARLVELGDSYQIQILECHRVLHRDPTLPAWNRIHILWGNFDDARDGFIARTSSVVRSLIGQDRDVHAVLSATSHYRVKPRMSKNEPLDPLCLAPRRPR